MHVRNLALSISAFALGAGLAQAQTLQSASVLEFADANTLFVADSVAGDILAFDLPQAGAAPEAAAAYNLLDLDGLLADALGADVRGFRYHDLAVHPVTRDAYVSLTMAVDGAQEAAVVTVTREGTVTRLDLGSLASDTFSLQDPADDGVSFWRDIPAPGLTVTDLDFANGELFVSGLSTGEFASTLRRVPYPFGDSASATGIEIFHAAHGQTETRAPIRAMTVLDLDGVSTVVAAYTCTPLVTLPVGDLQPETNITGRTIAELGYGNTPLEVLPFSAFDMQGNEAEFVLVINREMDADLIALSDLTAAAAAPGITEPIGALGDTLGVATTPIPMAGVFQAADQDPQFLLTLRRNLDTGSMDLVSFRKGAYFRLSEFISEYNFPDYEYADNQMSEGIRMFQNMLKADEDFPDQMR
jgi:hypothetical protein